MGAMLYTGRYKSAKVVNFFQKVSKWKSCIKLDIMEETLVLEGAHVLLRPLAHSHIQGLLEAAHEDPSLYQWTYVPQDEAAMTRYVEEAIRARDLGTAFPWVIIGKNDQQIKGCTRYWNIEKWDWKSGHPLDRNAKLDVCEIGHTWLRANAIRTGINTEAKLLLLANLFENWHALRVCFRTDERNKRSQAAIARIGGIYEGNLRADRMAIDYTIRNSYRYSILHSEWEGVKENLLKILKV